MLPINIEGSVDRLARRNTAEPAVPVRRCRVSVHDQSTRRRTAPFANQSGTSPRRRGFNNVGLQFVERCVQRLDIAKIVIFSIKRKRRILQIDDSRIGPALLNQVGRARRNCDDLVTGQRPGHHFAVDIRLNAAAIGRVKGRDVNNPHAGLLLQRAEGEQASAVHNADCDRGGAIARNGVGKRDFGLGRTQTCRISGKAHTVDR